MDRSELDFQNAVLKEFNYLINEFGFRLKTHDDFYMRFDSKKIYIEIFHERISYELYCCLVINKRFGKKSYVMLNELLSYLEIHDIKSEFQASNKESLIKCIKKVSSILYQYAKDELNGDMNNLYEIINEKI